MILLSKKITDKKRAWKTVKSLFSINLIHKEVINIAQDGRTLNSGSKIAEISKTCFYNVDDDISVKTTLQI